MAGPSVVAPSVVASRVVVPGASVARVDVVVWARALGVSSADEVQGELRRTGMRVAEVLALL